MLFHLRLLSRVLAERSLHALLVSAGIHTEAKLLPENLLQRAAISDIDPVALARALLVVHALSLDRPVKTLGSGKGGREPDLLVGRLLVKHVGTVGRESDVQDAGLAYCQLQSITLRQASHRRSINIQRTQPQHPP